MDQASGIRRMKTEIAILLLCIFALICGPLRVNSAQPFALPAVENQPAAIGPVMIGPVILDPCLGRRWQRVANPLHPSGPARLIEINAAAGSFPGRPRGRAEPTEPGDSTPVRPTVVIHAGDKVIVEQRTPLLTAFFEALALENAAGGQMLRVRLQVGKNSEMSANGPVIKVLGTGAGVALWQLEEGSGR